MVILQDGFSDDLQKNQANFVELRPEYIKNGGSVYQLATHRRHLGRSRSTASWQFSRFARLRVRAAHRDYQLSECRPEEWLLVEWPERESEPTKYWLSNLPEEIAFERLVDLTKLR
jgi:SRSO17 transposase